MFDWINHYFWINNVFLDKPFNKCSNMDLLDKHDKCGGIGEIIRPLTEPHTYSPK